MAMNIDNINVEGDASLQSIVLPAESTTTSLNGTLTLTNANNSAQILTGSATGFSVVLPNATTLLQGHTHDIYNNTGVTVTIKTNGGATLFVLSQNSTGYLYLISNGTAAGTWSSWQIIADPSIASGILNYKITSSTTFTTASATDVVVTSFSVTPQAGTYAIWYNASVTITTNNTLLRGSIYKGGILIADSTRASQASGGGWSGLSSTMTTSQFSGTQTCDVRVRSSSGNISVLDRTLIMIRLGN